MKLAEALALRADIQKRIAQLGSRLRLNALTQEGEQPAENPQELLVELERLIGELTSLMNRINQANLRTEVETGVTLTEALARRDTLKQYHDILNAVADAASSQGNRYSKTEIRMLPTVDVRALRRQIDDLAQQRRQLDVAIQAANWATELGE